MSNIIQDLIDEGVLELYIDSRSGVYWDRSGSSNDGAPSGTTLDYRGTRFPNTTSHVLVADSASLDVTEGCFGFRASAFSASTSERIAYKGGSSGWGFRAGGGTTRIIYAVGSATLISDPVDAKLISVNFKDTLIPTGYYDGASQGAFDGPVNFAPNAFDLTIGNDDGLTDPFGQIWECAYLTSRQLTATEQAAMAEYLEEPTFGEALPFQEGDVFLDHTLDGGEIHVTDGITQMIGGLETAVYLRLQGGNRDDKGQADTSKTWWANRLEGTPAEEQYRSRTQNALQSLPVTSASLKFIEGEAAADLQMFKDVGAATDIPINASIPAPNRIRLNIDIINGENRTSLVWEENWKAML
jgi:phage gp46-like protein